jgi:putative acetyltransferase
MVMLIRRETAADHDSVDAVHRAAFAVTAAGTKAGTTEAGGGEPAATEAAATEPSGTEPSGTELDRTEPVEVGLVRSLRSDAGWVPALSLVAEDPSGVVVGHVICTVGSLPGGSALGLGPIGVHPNSQRRGVGAALMHAVLGAADALDYAVVVLLGHLDYYPRFGFVPARSLGITPTEPAWGDHFQARPLSAWTPEIGGTFRYAKPFDAL